MESSSETFTSEAPIKISGIGKTLSGCDYTAGSLITGTKELFSFSFALEKPHMQKQNRKPRIEEYEKMCTKVSK